MKPRFPIAGINYRSEGEKTRHLASGAWISQTAGDSLREAANEVPDKLAVIAEDGSYSFRELDTLSESLAAGLIETGLRPGDRAVFQIGAVKEIFVTLFGCFKAGIVPLCTLPQYREIEIRSLGERAAATAYFVQGDVSTNFDQLGFARSMLEAMPSIRHLFVTRGVGGGGAFKADWRMMMGMVKCPSWAVAMLQNGQPRFANIQPYAGPNASLNDTITFARKEMGGAFSWDEVARYRDKWKKPLVVKGILHPADAEKAVSLGVDGILVSNHGGRQIEALPAPIDCVPGVVKAVGDRATVLFDSGVRSGTDVARALALGAKAALAGKTFLWSVGALGSEGPGHAIDLLIDELQSALGQVGARSPDEARNVMVRHPGAYDFGRNHP